LLLYWNY
jgi:hypothetical protein